MLLFFLQNANNIPSSLPFYSFGVDGVPLTLSPTAYCWLKRAQVKCWLKRRYFNGWPHWKRIPGLEICLTINFLSVFSPSKEKCKCLLWLFSHQTLKRPDANPNSLFIAADSPEHSSQQDAKCIQTWSNTVSGLQLRKSLFSYWNAGSWQGFQNLFQQCYGFEKQYANAKPSLLHDSPIKLC